MFAKQEKVTEIKEGDVVISTSFHRHTIAPRVKTGEEVDADGNVTKAFDLYEMWFD